jgi:hypothetical protein
MNLKRARNKLLKNGYLPEITHHLYEIWIDVTKNGTPISFSISGGDITGSFKVHGRTPDRPEVDEWYSDYSKNLSEAIRYSRVKG